MNTDTCHDEANKVYGNSQLDHFLKSQWGRSLSLGIETWVKDHYLLHSATTKSVPFTSPIL